MLKSVKTFRKNLLVFLTHSLALPLLKIIRRKKAFPYTNTQLKNMEQGTVGHDLYLMINRCNIQLLPYYEKHDIKHLLLEYDTTEEGEVCLQCCMLGNGHISFPVIATIIYGLLTMPEYYASFRKAFIRGQKMNNVKQWDWFQLIPLNTTEIKKQLNNENTYN
jgi:hypothetical protein